MIDNSRKVVIRKRDLYLFRRKYFLEEFETKELFQVEEYNRYTEEFEKTLIFNTQKEQLSYVEVMNRDLTTLKVRAINKPLKLVLEQKNFNQSILNIKK